MSVDITDQGYTVIVEEESNEVTVVAPGAAGALGYYGSFFSDQDQQAAAINTATAMTLNNTAEANGVSVVSNSRITFAYDGTYDIQFSAQFHHRGGGGNGTTLDIWFKKNGSNLADSATKLVIDKNKYVVAAWDYLLTVAAGDYLELFWQVDNADITLEHGAAAGNIPAIPSLIVTAMQVMYNQVGPVGPQGPTGATGAKGDKGDKGDTGDAATIAVGTTSTLAPGSSATVTNSGTSSAAVFDFGIPEGDKGDKGDKGDTGATGATGPQGPSGVISVTAPITNTGTSTSALLGLSTGTGLSTAGGVLAADIGTTSTTVASGDRGLPTGGGTGQVLAKQSGSNYDTQWVTPTTDAPVSASYVTLSTDGTLTSERVLTAGTGISVTDAGAGSTVTVATSAILPTVVDAKGDLIAGTASDTVARLGVGADDTVLMAASGETTGLAWRSPRLAGGAARPLLTGGAYLDGTTGLVLTGLASNFASAPDSAALSVTGDIDIIMRVKATDWTPSTTQSLLGKEAASNLSYNLFIGANSLRFQWSSNGTAWNQAQPSPNLNSQFVDGTTYWVRVTLDVDNAGQWQANFYVEADSTNVPTWGAPKSTVNGSSGTTSIFDGNAALQIGASGSSTILDGTIYRTIIKSGIDGTTVFDANFSTQTADALAFTESSTNAATVTINTTRYTIGIPNGSLATVTASGLTANRTTFTFFTVTAPIVVDALFFEAQTLPATTATVRAAIFAVDANCQATGSPVVNFGSQSVSATTLGVYAVQVSPVTLQPGTYALVHNASVLFAHRLYRMLNLSTAVATTMGSSSFPIQYFVAQTNPDFSVTTPRWDSRTLATGQYETYSLIRWRAA